MLLQIYITLMGNMDVFQEGFHENVLLKEQRGI